MNDVQAHLTINRQQWLFTYDFVPVTMINDIAEDRRLTSDLLRELSLAPRDIFFANSTTEELLCHLVGKYWIRWKDHQARCQPV